MNDPASKDADLLPFARLVQAECPARVRDLLDGVYRIAWPVVGAALVHGLDELEGDLFRHAERAPNVNEQNLCFESQRELRRRREEFLTACRDGVQRSLLHLVDPSVPESQLRTTEHVRKPRAQLSLVDPTHLEEVLVLVEVAMRAEMRAGDELQALAYRLALIVGGAPADLDAVALGPHGLCGALRAASECFDIALMHRMALYRRMDKALFADAASLYAALNRHLVAEGILPWLHLVPRRVVKRNAGERVPPPSAFAPAPAAAVPPADGGTGAVPPTPAAAPGPSAAPVTVAAPPATEMPVPTPPTPMPAATTAAPEAATAQAATPAAAPLAPVTAPWFEGPAMQAFRRSLGGEPPPAAPAAPVAAPLTSVAPPPDVAHADAAAAAESADELSFDTLRELLAGRPHLSATERNAAQADRPVASEPDVDAALAALQSRTPLPKQIDGRLVHRSVADVKREILAQLRAHSDGAPPRLRPEDSDAIDLVGFLFDHLLADQTAGSPAPSLLTRLQLPLIKVALKDKHFFTQTSHPARQLLNAVVETAAHWVEDDHQDRAIVEKMNAIVERVGRDFDGGLGVFERTLDDLTQHVSGLKKKAGIAERHHVEAARGREKLDLARADATQAVNARLDRAQPPAAVRTLLEHAWTDSLALAYLRHGHDHPQSVGRLQFVDRLIDLFGHGRPPAECRFELQALRPEFEEGLASIGYHNVAVEKAWTNIAQLVDDRAETTAEAAASTVQALVEQQPRLGEVRKDTAVAQSRQGGGEPAQSLLKVLRKERPPIGPREAEMVERIKRLPFGTWFEFILNQQGDKSRRKLCWFSPVTGHCLFVNTRGAKVLERNIEELAIDLVRGNARIVEESRDNLIDRAWKSIVAMLRGAGPNGRNAQPAAG